MHSRLTGLNDMRIAQARFCFIHRVDPRQNGADLRRHQLQPKRTVMRSTNGLRACFMPIVAAACALVAANAGAISLSAGYAHACMIDDAGHVDCWGWNGGGQLGVDGSGSRVAVRVAALPPNIASIAGGTTHTCALTADAVVVCWGGNSLGELGRDTGGQVIDNPPEPVAGLDAGVTAIAGSRTHSCVLTGAGGIECWGLNEAGQLGNSLSGPGEFSAVPVEVPLGPAIGKPPVVAVSAGSGHSCAIDDIGDVRCWGYNGFGQAGIEPTAPYLVIPSVASPPPSVNFAVNAIQVAVGGYHTCALLDGGAVKCWGWNGVGELGNGSIGADASTFEPQPVTDLDGDIPVTQITAGEGHSCALLDTTEVRCWGDNSWGQLGDGTATTRSEPVAVVGLPPGGIESIAAGFDFSCAHFSNGETRCWGNNRNGELGAGGTLFRPDPVLVQGLPEPIVDIESGNVHACALGESGTVSCWGRNYDGQVGDGSALDRPIPVALAGFEETPTKLASGPFHNCIASAGGRMHCWGYNYYGQLGDGSTQPSPIPSIAFDIVPAPTALEAGSMLGQSCALSGGALQCWGARFGMQASGAPLTNTTPYSLDFYATIEQFALGEEHGCLRLDSGSVWCWGNNFSEQFGNAGYANVSAFPLQTPTPSDAVALAAGRWHTCAVTIDGAIECWGGNLYDTLGDGISEGGVGSSSSIPIVVAGFDGSSDEQRGNGVIASLALHTCAVNRLNQVKCWGLADAGQLGNPPDPDGYFESTRPMATTVDLQIGPIIDLAVGTDHSCALSDTGTVACWGATTYGQLGNGELGYSAMPVLVQQPLFSNGFESPGLVSKAARQARGTKSLVVRNAMRPNRSKDDPVSNSTAVGQPRGPSH
jgi:alpha-tubulin suppressor-like RCC1 family protein